MNHQQKNSPSHLSGKFKDIRSLLAKSKFRFLIFILFLCVTPSVFLILDLAVSINVFYLINKFPKEAKAMISINALWFEVFIGLTMPIFLSLALSIQLAILKPQDAATTKNILPWVFPLRKFFFSKLPVFFVFTAAVFLGVIIFLTFGSDVYLYEKLSLVIFPIIIFYLGVMIRQILSEDPIQGRVGQYMLKKPRAFTIFFLVLAFIVWIYTEIWLPISSWWDLFIYFFKSLSTS